MYYLKIDGIGFYNEVGNITDSQWWTARRMAKKGTET
jgi:hypothetical protein